MLKKALAVGITAVGLAGAGNASALLHDFNGAEAGGVVSSDSWDFAPGNSLLQDIVPVAGLSFGTWLSQGAIQGNGGGMQFGGTGSIDDAGGNGFGWTYKIVAPVTATFLGSLGGNDFYDLGILPGSTFEIYYDSLGKVGGGTPYSDITGLGYHDGDLVLSGTILAGQVVTNSVDSVASVPSALDQFGTDNQPGVTTHDHSGTASFEIDITFENPLYFPFQSAEDGGVVADGEVDITWSGDYSAPFTAENPSDSVVGATPNYDGAGLTGVNDNACTVAATCDLHVETDSRVAGLPASIPEPTTVALMGLGMLGLGLRRRRNG